MTRPMDVGSLTLKTTRTATALQSPSSAKSSTTGEEVEFSDLLKGDPTPDLGVELAAGPVQPAVAGDDAPAPQPSRSIDHTLAVMSLWQTERSSAPPTPGPDEPELATGPQIEPLAVGLAVAPPPESPAISPDQMVIPQSTGAALAPANPPLPQAYPKHQSLPVKVPDRSQGGPLTTAPMPSVAVADRATLDPKTRAVSETQVSDPKITVVSREQHFAIGETTSAFSAVTAKSTFATAAPAPNETDSPNVAGLVQQAAAAAQTPALRQTPVDPVPATVLKAAATEDPQPAAWLQQITDQIKPHLPLAQSAPSSPSPAAGFAPPQSGATAQSSPIKVLVVRLEPAELGIVTVKLTMRGDVLTVGLEAKQHGTATLLEQQRSTLIGDLVTTGQKIADISVTVSPDASSAPTQPRPAHTPVMQDGAMGMPGGEGQGSQGSGRGSGHLARRAEPEKPALVNGTEEWDDAARSRRAGIYL